MGEKKRIEPGRVIDAMWKTGETRVEREKSIEQRYRPEYPSLGRLMRVGWND